MTAPSVTAPGVAELTGLLDLTAWPPGMRVIARKERPHPGAQLRITDIDGLRVTAFATNTPAGGGHGQLADLELRHRRRARCEDRIRIAKDTGLRALPLHDFSQNQIWIAIVELAADLLAWMGMLALAGTDARRWEPKRLRLRLFTVPATLARHGRRRRIHYADKHPWATLARDAIHRLQQLPLGPVSKPRRGRPQQWCSQACRRAIYEERRAAKNGAIAIEYVERAAPEITLNDHVAAVLGSPTACRNVLRQLRARHGNGELADAKWSSVSDELERLRTPPGRRPDAWFSSR